MNAAPTKAALRAEALARRDTITTAAREAASRVIAERAASILADKPPRILAAYMPIWSEVDPAGVIAWAFRNDIAVGLPVVLDHVTMAFRRYRPGDTLIAHRFGTQTPGPEAELVDPDAIVSPMIAFDRKGTRLGHGRGFYDRGIARLHAAGLKPLLIGLAFAAQEVAEIPAEAHDVRMDWIVTEREMLDFRNTGEA